MLILLCVLDVKRELFANMLAVTTSNYDIYVCEIFCSCEVLAPCGQMFFFYFKDLRSVLRIAQRCLMPTFKTRLSKLITGRQFSFDCS